MQLTPALAQALIDTILDGGCTIIAPISQPRPDGDKLPHPEGWVDYIFEQEQPQKMWNNPINGKGGKPGDLFAFFHQSAKIGGPNGRLEYYRIVEVLPPTAGETLRPHWHSTDREGRHSNRAVLVLGDKIGEATFDDFKHFHQYKSTLERIAGTRRTSKWNPCLLDELKLLLPSEKMASLATLWVNPPAEETLKVMSVIAQKLQSGYKLYDNSMIAAARSFDMIMASGARGYGISIADLQSGKSGMCVILATAARSVMEARFGFTGKLGVLFITHISDRSIVAQTKREHFEKAGWKQQYFSHKSQDRLYRNKADDKTFMHIDMLSGGAFRDGKEDARSRLSAAVQNLQQAGCEKLLVISDEVQVASNLDQQFAKWLSTMNFSINAPNPNLFMLGVTATATKFYSPLSDGGSLFVCYNKPGDAYYGLRHMLDEGRIIDNDGLITCADDLETILRQNGALAANGKYILARHTNGRFGAHKQEEIWKTVAVRNGLQIMPFNSSEHNIEHLNERLAFALPEDHPPVILLIKGALQAGITLETVENIAFAFDAYTGQDAVVQSLPGRMCGNQQDRRMATFPIYSKKNAIEQYVAEINDLADNVLPQCTTKSSTLKYKQASAIKIGTLEEFRSERIAKGHTVDGANTIYGHTKKDFAKILLRGKWPDHALRAVSLGYKESEFKYDTSVTALLKKYPALATGNVLWVDAVPDDGRPVPKQVHNALPE